MALKRLSDLKVGDLFKVTGRRYQVSSTGVLGYVFRKEIAPGIFGDAVTPNQVFQDYKGPQNELVTVEEVASGSQSDLTSELRQQVKQNALTESLRAQVDEEDEEDGNGDEQDYNTPHNHYTHPSSHSHSYLDGGHVPVFNPHGLSNHSAFDGFATKVNVPGLTEAKQSALSANLRAQSADQKATQAQLNSAIAKAKATGAQASVDYVATRLQGVAEDVVELRSEASHAFEDVAYDVGNVWGTVHTVSDRVTEIENKLQEEENKVSIQNELDRKLALQSQFNAATKKQKSTGGNKMTNLLAGFKNQFGKVEQKFAFSAVTQGLAIRKGITNEFVAFNSETGEITDVTGLTLDFKVPAFKLPTAVAEIKKGDIVLNGADYGYVTRVNDGFVEVIIPEKNVRGSVIPTKNALMNASFYTVVKTLDAAGQGGFNPMMLLAMGDGEIDATTLMLMGGLGGAQAGQAGGIQSMLPFLLMGDKEGGKGSKDLLPLLAMSGGLGGAQTGGFNPMMLALAGDGEIDATTLMLMSGGFGGNGGGLFGQAPAVPTPAPTADTDADNQ